MKSGYFPFFRSPETSESSTNAKALREAEEALPCIYYVVNAPTKLISLIAGCQGDAGKAQIETAMHMRKHPHHEKNFCGDNTYVAVKHPDDACFSERFHKLYPATISNYIGEGNHDGGLDSWSSMTSRLLSTPQASWSKEIIQVAHTYLLTPPAFFKQPLQSSEKTETNLLIRVIDYNHPVPWFLPTVNYAVCNSDIFTIHLNTNTIVRDYLEYLRILCKKEQPDPLKNQIAFLLEAYDYAKKTDKIVRFSQHHPLFCFGKRAFPDDYDGKIYLTYLEILKIDLILQLENDSPLILQIIAAEDEETLKAIPDLPPFSDLLRVTKYGMTTIDYASVLNKLYFIKLGCSPRIIYVAHEHALHKSTHIIEVKEGDTFVQKVITQICSGGGGGPKQEHMYFGHRENLSAFYFKHGYFLTTFDPETRRFLIDLWTNDDHHLRFWDDEVEPIILETNDTQIKLLRTCILEAVDQYQDFLEKTQGKGKFHAYFSNQTHEIVDAQISDDLKNYVNQYEPRPFDEALHYIYKECFEKLCNVKMNDKNLSLHQTLQNSFLKHFDQSLQELYGKLLSPSNSLTG